jgi:hypothetical protein
MLVLIGVILKIGLLVLDVLLFSVDWPRGNARWPVFVVIELLLVVLMVLALVEVVVADE